MAYHEKKENSGGGGIWENIGQHLVKLSFLCSSLCLRAWENGIFINTTIQPSFYSNITSLASFWHILEVLIHCNISSNIKNPQITSLYRESFALNQPSKKLQEMKTESGKFPLRILVQHQEARFKFNLFSSCTPNTKKLPKSPTFSGEMTSICHQAWTTIPYETEISFKLHYGWFCNKKIPWSSLQTNFKIVHLQSHFSPN